MNNRNRLIAFAASLLASSMLVAHAAPATAKAAKAPVAHAQVVKQAKSTNRISVAKSTSKAGKRTMSKTHRAHRKISKRAAQHK